MYKLTDQRLLQLSNPHHFSMLTASLSVLLLLLATLVAALAWSWAPDRPVDALMARWAAPPSYFVALQGMQVHVRDVYSWPNKMNPALVNRYDELTLR